MNIDQEMWNQWHILDFGPFYTYSKGKSGFLELYLAIFDSFRILFSLYMKETSDMGSYSFPEL